MITFNCILQLSFEFFNVQEHGGADSKANVVQCATEIGEYIGDHGNWDDLDISSPGCPVGNFDPAAFPKRWNSWYCDEESTAGMNKDRNVILHYLWDRAYIGHTHIK